MKNILVIGEAGVGKSSLINLVLGNNSAVPSDATTEESPRIEMHHHNNFYLFDTVGYNEACERSPTEAITNLARFVTSIKHEGISLIIYVMKKGRINAVSRKNYDYFVKYFCNNQVPVLLVVTHCENETCPSDWYASHRQDFINFGMYFSGDVCGCCVDLENPALDKDRIPLLTLKRNETQEQVRLMIEQLALGTSWKPSSWTEWIGKIFYGVFKVFGVPYCVIAFLSSTASKIEVAAVDAIKSAFAKYVDSRRYSNRVQM